MSLKDIPLTEELKSLGVTSISKDTNSIQLILNSQTIVILDILPGQVLKTIENFKAAAKREKIDATRVNKIAILLLNTPDCLQILHETNGKRIPTDNGIYNENDQQFDKDQESMKKNSQSTINSPTEINQYTKNGDYVEYAISTCQEDHQARGCTSKTLVLRRTYRIFAQSTEYWYQGPH